MSIPVAVSPSVKTPGLYMTVNLLAGAASPGTGELRLAILATKSSSGDLTDDTEVRVGTGIDGAETAFGEGTLGHLMAKIIYGKYPRAIVDFVSPAAGAGTATLDVTAGGAVGAAGNVIDCDIMGRTFEYAWAYGTSSADVATALIAMINARSDDLAVVASSGGASIVTIDSKVNGNIGNDILVKMKLRNAQTGTETLTGATTHTNLASGSADPDLTNALAAIAGREYHFILPALSNADLDQVATDNNLQRTLDHIATYDTGLDCKLQQVVVGYTGSTVATAVTNVADANGANDDGRAQYFMGINARSLPGELAAREAVGRIAMISVDPAGNRIGEEMDLIVGSHDVVADRPTATELETGLDGGVTMLTYNTDTDAEQLSRPVTCHGSDDRLIDVQNVDAAYIVSRDVRDNLPLAFPNAKISEDIAEGEEPPPEGVVEIRDVRAWVIKRLRAWVRKGVIQSAPLDAAIADGSLAVEINSSDTTQVDIAMPFKIVQPWAKTGVTAQRLAS